MSNTLVIPWSGLKEDLKSGELVSTPYEVICATYPNIALGSFHHRAHRLLLATLQDKNSEHILRRRGVLVRVCPDRQSFCPEVPDDLIIGEDAFTLSFPHELPEIGKALRFSPLAALIQSRASNLPDLLDIFSQTLKWPIDLAHRIAILRKNRLAVLPPEFETFYAPMISLIATPFRYYAFIRAVNTTYMTDLQARVPFDRANSYYERTIATLNRDLRPNSIEAADNMTTVLSIIAQECKVAMYVAYEPKNDFYELQTPIVLN